MRRQHGCQSINREMIPVLPKPKPAHGDYSPHRVGATPAPPSLTDLFAPALHAGRLHRHVPRNAGESASETMLLAAPRRASRPRLRGYSGATRYDAWRQPGVLHRHAAAGAPRRTLRCASRGGKRRLAQFDRFSISLAQKTVFVARFISDFASSGYPAGASRLSWSRFLVFPPERRRWAVTFGMIGCALMQLALAGAVISHSGAILLFLVGVIESRCCARIWRRRDLFVVRGFVFSIPRLDLRGLSPRA
jgi:hypothetical protein